MIKTNLTIASALTLSLALVSNCATASNLISNGNFETLTNGSGQLGFNTNVVGWTPTGDYSIGYSFVFTPGVADTIGATGRYSNVAIWGNGNGAANGFDGTLPSGGNIVAINGDFLNAGISQNVSGLTVGTNYLLTFEWAASQQAGYTGATSQYLAVDFGGTTVDTSVANIASKGFSGWIQESIQFTATAGTELLSINGIGNLPVPPFALLSDVALNAAVPEPEMVSMFGIGLLGHK